MKKILLLSAILIIMLPSFAQTTYAVSSVTIGDLNEYTNKYSWGKYIDADLVITIKNNIILIDDNANSHYIIGEKILDRTNADNVKQVGWDAKDEANRGCTVKISTYPDGSKMLYVMYFNKAFGYTIKN